MVKYVNREVGVFMITVDKLKTLISLTNTETEPEYSKILTSLEAYNNLSNTATITEKYTALKTFNTDIDVYLTKYQDSPKNPILLNAKFDCIEELGKIYSQGIRTIKKNVFQETA